MRPLFEGVLAPTTRVWGGSSRRVVEKLTFSPASLRVVSKHSVFEITHTAESSDEVKWELTI